VRPPIKTPNRYEFRVDVVGRPLTASAVADRIRSVVRGYGSPFRTTLQFGFRAANYTIAHAEVWDSIVPLLFLTRVHGPLYKAQDRAAVIRFRYPILEPVLQFFVRRAANLGLSVEVEADTFERTYDIRGRGSIISFGSGKESRALLGALRELGHAPRLSTGGAADRPVDQPSAEFSHLIQGVTTERKLPGLMAGAAHYYYGSVLGEVHLTTPWQQYYDFASPQGQAELTGLFQSLGVDLTLHAPLAVLPANVVQHLLAARYRDLFAYQRSVTPGSPGEKNLDVSLLKLYRGLAFSSHCSETLFRRLLREFVDRSLAQTVRVGLRPHREVFHREMRAIIWRCRDHPLLSEVRSRIQPEWDARWIDGIHVYANRAVDPAMLEIFRQHAHDYEPGPGEYRVPTPGAPESHVT